MNFLKQLIKNNDLLFSLALKMKEKKETNVSLQLEEEIEYLEALRRDGVVAIPNFFTEEESEQMIRNFNSIDEKFVHITDNDRRVFGINHLSRLHQELFTNNEMFKRIGEAYCNDELILQSTMAAKITQMDGVDYGSGGCWHRDSFSQQFKAISYLSDVEKENGPFMYIKGSHKLENILKVIKELKRDIPASNYRYSLDEIDKIKDILNEDITYITAPKGSLVMADVRGLHTGMPIQKGNRYTIFNYYITKSYHQPNNVIESMTNKNLELVKNELF